MLLMVPRDGTGYSRFPEMGQVTQGSQKWDRLLKVPRNRTGYSRFPEMGQVTQGFPLDCPELGPTHKSKS